MDVGIIGGADGPTAVLVTSQIPLWVYAAGSVALILGIIAIAFLIKRK